MANQKVIVTGGTGYLGLCTAHVLSRNGWDPILIDNFSTSTKPKNCPFPLFTVDLADANASAAIFREIGKAEALLHFAAHALVGESCEKPADYYRNNILAALNSLEGGIQCGVRRFVHSSSCTVYGHASRLPLDETVPLGPINPYGETKLAVERMFQQYAQHKKIRSVNLRYFNPAGALKTAQGWVGEAHQPETHLIPLVVNAAITAAPVTIFGGDYPTKDGTCIRDFIHVEDLAEAHVAALKYLENSAHALPGVNLGAGMGASVKDVIALTEKTLDKKVKTVMAPRRAGDPAELWANIDLAKKLFGWVPRFTLKDCIQTHASFLNPQ